MIEAIESHRDSLTDLCRRFHVRRLDVFGSAAMGTFDEASDLDFLVDFEPVDSMTLADQYFGLLAALEDLFDRRIDLVSARSLRNPWFIRSVQESSRSIYAA